MTHFRSTMNPESNIELNFCADSELRFELRIGATMNSRDSSKESTVASTDDFPRVPVNTPEQSDHGKSDDSVSGPPPKVVSKAEALHESSKLENKSQKVSKSRTLSSRKYFNRVANSEDTGDTIHKPTHGEGLQLKPGKRSRTDLSTKYARSLLQSTPPNHQRNYIDENGLETTDESEDTESVICGLEFYNKGHVESGFIPTADILTNYIEEYQIRMRRSLLSKQAIRTKNKRTSRKFSTQEQTETSEQPLETVKLRNETFRDQEDERLLVELNLKDSFDEAFLSKLQSVCQHNQDMLLMGSWFKPQRSQDGQALEELEFNKTSKVVGETD